MVVRKSKFRRALTLIELMVTTLAALVLIVGISSLLFHGHMGYRRLFNRVNSEVVRNAYEARLTFDRIVRSADTGHAHISPNELWVYYYTAPSVDELISLIRPNRYAHFIVEAEELALYQGDLDASADLSLPPPPNNETRTVVATNVASCEFTQVGLGSAIRMVLTLDNETDPPPGRTKLETSMTTISTTAIRHNNSLQVEL